MHICCYNTGYTTIYYTEKLYMHTYKHQTSFWDLNIISDSSFIVTSKSYFLLLQISLSF